MASEATLILVKPDAMKRKLLGNVLSKLVDLDLEIVALKIVRVSKDLAEKHYAEHKDKPFFQTLVNYFAGEKEENKVVGAVLVGEDAVQKVRKRTGDTHPEKAEENTIRGMYGRITTEGIFENVIHASAALDEAEREIKLWFRPQEILVDLFETVEIDSNNKEICWK